AGRGGRTGCGPRNGRPWSSPQQRGSQGDRGAGRRRTVRRTGRASSGRERLGFRSALQRGIGGKTPPAIFSFPLVSRSLTSWAGARRAGVAAARDGDRARGQAVGGAATAMADQRQCEERPTLADEV